MNDLLATAIIGLLGSDLAHAADSPVPENASAPLGVIEVAGAKPAPLPAGAGADVIGIDTIEKLGRHNVADALDLPR